MNVRRGALIGAFGLAGCLRGEVAADGPATGAPPPAVSMGTSSVATSEVPPTMTDLPAPEPPLPGPHRRRLQAAVAENARCVSCHAEQAAEWRGSRHRQAYTNAAFRKAFTIEPTAFCRGCHAPESDPVREPPRAVADLGVGCVTCHVTEEGVVLAAASSAAGDEGGAPHPIRRSAGFARTGGCAGCHEFRFPLAPGDDDGQLMQTTVREHERSPSAATACAACHMPLSGQRSRWGTPPYPRRSHAFAGVRDPAWLRSHLDVTAERVDDRTVRITLVQPTPGHGFPTGDLFRRLEVGGEIRDAGATKTLARDVRHLARHFAIVPGRPGRQLARDDRVFDAPAVIELGLGRPGPVSWWVTYQRVATVGAGTDPADARIESAVPLHAGVLP